MVGVGRPGIAGGRLVASEVAIGHRECRKPSDVDPAACAVVRIRVVGDVAGELAGVQRNGGTVVATNGSALGAAVAREGAVREGDCSTFAP